MIKIGVLGNSSIAKKSIIPAIKKSKNFDLCGIGSRNKETGKSYDDILNSDVDVIYVSLPIGLHFKWGKKVLESGKHLLLEKTFTENYKQAKELFDLAKSSNLFCMEALMYEFHPLQKQIDSLLTDIGDIKSVEAHFGFPHFEDKSNIRYKKELGGGAILDCLVYPLSFIFKTLGSDFINYDSTILYDKENDVDERGYIKLTYNKSVGNISYGFGHAYRNEITIWGTKSILKLKRIFSRPENCDEHIEVWTNGVCKVYEVDKKDHFLEMLNSFYDGVTNKKTFGEKTLKRMLFLDLIRKNSVLKKLYIFIYRYRIKIIKND